MESLGELGSLAERNEIPLVAVDEEGVIRFVREGTADLLGWTREELLGQPLACLLPSGWESTTFLATILESTGELHGKRVRATLVRREGVEKDFILAATTARMPGHRVRVLALEPLAEVPDTVRVPVGASAGARSIARAIPGIGYGHTDQLYRLLFEQAPLGVFYFDADGVVTACNPRLLEMLGTTREKTLGLHLLSLPDKRLVAAVRDSLQGKSASYQTTYTSVTGGKTLPVESFYSPVFDAEGEVVGGMAIVVDVSERKRLEHERDLHLARLETLLDTAPIGIAFLDTSCRFVRVNHRLAEINGRPEAAHLGRTPEDILGSTGAILRHVVEHVLAAGKSITGHHVSTSDLGVEGPWRSWDVSFYPVRENDRIIGVGALVEEVTEHAKAEHERERLYQESRDAVQVRDDFLSVASHELKTPLTPLSIRLATIERKLEQGQPVPLDLVRKARGSLGKLTVLINDLLDVARIRAGRLTLHVQRVDLGGLLERSVAAQREGRPGPVSLRSSGGPVHLDGDPARLEQVFDNLLDNAAKYSAPDEPIEVSLEVGSDHAVVSVHDRGIGIPEEQRALLFERFFRARNASSRSAGGLGLGLYISRDIVDRHGGRISVESEQGKGSTFRVELPLSQGRSHQETSKR